MRILSIFTLFFAFGLHADVSRFIDDSIEISDQDISRSIFKTKVSPLISSSSFNVASDKSDVSFVPEILKLSREILETKLSESIAHRYQATGKIVAYLSREWKPVDISSNFIIKITDCSPDEISPSTFVRFSIWDNGKLVGEYSEPVRLSQYVDVFYSSKPLQRGVRLASVQLESKPVDVLKQFAGSVPASSNVKGYQLSTNLRPNTPLKWNYLSKLTLVRKGQVVNVFASGNGIYVTMKGMALEDGVEGGMVTVQNLSSDKRFQAKVLTESSVKVHL